MTPKTHHIDRHALKIADEIPRSEASADVLLTQAEMAAWFRCSEQWLASGRSRDYGPPFERVGHQLIRYNRRKVLAWLDERSHLSTAEYDTTRFIKSFNKRKDRKPKKAGAR